MQNFEQKTALVTGGALRVGALIVSFLKKHGYKTILTYNHSYNEALELQRKSEVDEIIHIDFNNFQKLDLPKLDRVINNASIFEKEEKLDLELLRQNLNVHIAAPIAFGEFLFQQSSGGHMINIIDQMEKSVGRNFISYYLTKELLKDFTLKQSQLYHSKVRVNAIAPKILMKHHRQSEEHFQNMLKDQKSDPIDELLEKILYLEQSDITGKII